MRFRTVAAGATLSVVLACAGGPGPGDSGYPYNVDGSYRGRLFVEGEPFDAELVLRTTSGGAVQGSFRVGGAFRIDGGVAGVVVDELLRLTVTYRGSTPPACAGQIEGILTVAAGGDVVEGPVTISDCADPVSGRMSFRR